MGKTAKPGEVVATASGLVMARDKADGARPAWRTVVIVGAVILIALVAGGAARWVQTRHSPQAAFRPSAAQQKANSIQNVALSGDYKTAQQQLDQALANPKLTTDERVSLLGVQATTYENQKEYQKALDVFRQLDRLQPTEGSAQAIGQVAAAAGDKEGAIAAYKLAIARLDKNSPVADADKARYQRLIADLGGKP